MGQPSRQGVTSSSEYDVASHILELRSQNMAVDGPTGLCPHRMPEAQTRRHARDRPLAALERAHELTLAWLASLDQRPVPPQASIDEIVETLGPDLPERGSPASEVVDLLAKASDRGLTAMPSGRFFGFVIGGTHPAALATDWLVSAWDQNSGLRRLTPAHSAVEDIAGAWLLELLELPVGSAVGFVTGGTMANFTGLAAGRDAVLRRAGQDVATRGLAGGPQVRVLVGAERHDTVDLALRYLGLGAPEPVAVDEQGRVDATALEDALRAGLGRPTVVALQAGNVHSGAFDPFTDAIAAAHAHGAWVHVDGAFGLWAGASPAYRHLVEGVAQADSWATDAHKTLNVPYDSGLAIVRDPADLRAAMGMHGAYLIHDAGGEPLDKVPEISRRGRALPVWAVLRALGRVGVADLVERLCSHATAFAEGASGIPGAEVLNDVVFTQVCLSFGDDQRTTRVLDAMMADGTAWMTGSTWRERAVLRISVSNWSTTEGDVRRSLDALRRAAAAA
jgi:glutamate/tyrosine decarboxylase-like PLP-dependent enzyme